MFVLQFVIKPMHVSHVLINIKLILTICENNSWIKLKTV